MPRGEKIIFLLSSEYCFTVANVKKFLSCALFLSALVLIAVKPDPYLEAAYRGWELFVKSVLPSLVPFAFVTSFMTLSGSAEVLFRLLSKPAKRLFSTSGAGGYVFAVSLVSGYPIGAKTISELRKCDCISDDALTGILAFGSTAGPLFVLGSVGVKLLGDFSAGAAIFLSHVLGTLINGAVFGRLYKCSSDPGVVTRNKELKPLEAFREALQNTVSAALTVSVCMILFNVAAELLGETGILKMAGAALESIGLPEGAGEGFVAGLTEVTLGVKRLSEALPVKQAAPLIAALVSFGGMSVQMQSMFFLGDAGVKGKTFLMLKIAQTIFTYAAASVVCALLL